MTNAKELFLRPHPDGKPGLAQWWVAIARDDRFLQVLTYCRADLMESTPSQEVLRGAEAMVATLLTICNNEPDRKGDIPSPGINHRPQLAPPSRAQSEKETKK